MTTFYGHMSGSSGCLPDDQTGPFDDLVAAVESAISMFSDDGASESFSDAMVEEMRADLFSSRIFYFPAEYQAGADYVEIVDLTEDEAREWREADDPANNDEKPSLRIDSLTVTVNHADGVTHTITLGEDMAWQQFGADNEHLGRTVDLAQAIAEALDDFNSVARDKEDGDE